jgi:hypothetical protein
MVMGGGGRGGDQRTWRVQHEELVKLVAQT